MSSINMLKWIGIGLIVIAGDNLASAQHNWARTLTVDPTQGAADHQNIQDAIDDNKIGLDPSDRYTVLVYAGTYNENVTLGGQKENVDLVGVDRDAVIIAPSSGDGITITSGTETSRNNSIRSLTIKTTNGHGIEIVKGPGGSDQPPKDILIENVTIEVAGSAKLGICAAETQDLHVTNCKITTGNGHGIEFVKPGGGSAPNDIVIESVTIEAAGAAMHGITGYDAEQVRVFKGDVTAAGSGVTYGIKAGKYWTIESTFAESKSSSGYGVLVRDFSLVRSSHCKSDNTGLRITGDGVRVDSGIYEGGTVGVVIGLAQNVVIRDSLLRGDYSIGVGTAAQALVADESSNENILVKGCRLEAIGNGKLTRGVWHDIDVMRLEDCAISAVNLANGQDDDDRAIGVHGAAGGETLLIGGTIVTRSNETKETEVWDLFAVTATGCQVSGTRFSKWKGPIGSAERPRSVVQRTIDVDAPDPNWILVETDLPTSGPDDFQELDPSNQPDVYRTLAVRGVEVGGSFSITGDVFVVGTDWGGNRIAESFDISTGSYQDIGDKPFKTVTKIYLPIDASNIGKVRVGTTSKLGLYFPISATSDVLQLGKKASAATSYTIQGSVGTVDATYATVQPLVAIAAGDSFEWVVLASQ